MVAPPKEIIDEKPKEEKLEPLQDTGVDIKHVIRGINTSGQFGTDGSEPVDVVNDYIKSFLLQGYKLIYVQHLRSNMAMEGNAVLSEQMLYVLLKDERTA